MERQTFSSTEWSRDRVEQTAARIYDPEKVDKALAVGRAADATAIRDLLQKATRGLGLACEEAAALLQVEAPGLQAEIIEAARQIHAENFRRRITLTTPICPSNRCVNDCLYCPLRRSDAKLKRRSATAAEVQREVMALLDEGYRCLMVVMGDDRSGVPYLRDLVSAVYGVRSGYRQIERVDININPLSLAELRELRQALRLGIYHVFQETYDPEVYARLHPDGPKSDYAWRLTCHDRAYEAGFETVGMGILLGVSDYRPDIVAMLMHAQYLAEIYGRAPHSITYPRLIPAQAAPASHEPACDINDDVFRFVIAVTRLALPTTELILCTPVPTEVRRDLYGLGISQVSIGSLSYPGAYTSDGDPSAAGVLAIGRPRALEALIYRLCEAGFLPNLCCTCLRVPTRGLEVPEGAEKWSFQDRHTTNALVALKEYLLDHASFETQMVGNHLIQKQLSMLSGKIRSLVVELLEEVEAGLRRQRI